jgi:hypothetical protein
MTPRENGPKTIHPTHTHVVISDTAMGRGGADPRTNRRGAREEKEKGGAVTGTEEGAATLKVEHWHAMRHG